MLGPLYINPRIDCIAYLNLVVAIYVGFYKSELPVVMIIQNSYLNVRPCFNGCCGRWSSWNIPVASIVLAVIYSRLDIELSARRHFGWGL